MSVSAEKRIKSISVSIFEMLAFLVIISFAVRLLCILVYPDYFFKNTSLMVNTRVFTTANNKYSLFLGGEVYVLAFKKDGTVENIKPVKQLFNHSYNKVITNILSSKFEVSVEKKDPKVSSRYLAAKQIFCADIKNEKVQVIRKLISQNISREVREYINTIDCKN